MTTITIEKVMELKDCILIDTRSPKEFELDCLPNSISIPIFTNNERHEIGLLYKQSQEKAFDLGFSIYSQKLTELQQKINQLDHSKIIIVYCWRGGMRSKAITELVESLGYQAYQLEGGYKSYRAYLQKKLELFQPRFKFIVLYGLAGSGKTELIKLLPAAIDLEGLAQHRSSNFGSLGLKPNSQKKFETLLYEDLKKFQNEKFVFIEGESRRIGNVLIPENIFKALQKGLAVKVNRSLQERIKQIIKDYFTHHEDELIKKIINNFKQYLGNKTIEEIFRLIDEKNYAEVSKIFLEKYYDPKYTHQLNQIKFEFEVNDDDLNLCIQELLKIKKELNLIFKN